MAEIDLIVFDLDGTLVDTRQDLTDAVNYALQKLGKPPLDVDTVTRNVGDGVRMLLLRTLKI
ncbi:MAG: HAD hydrolase-like protein, partial [candidate division KSB1 bacterium]|nr:HAD hydrolase-like protein [candidate division KSB1 bacterium]